MGIGFDTAICLGCGHVGRRPGPPAISCCPERDTVTLHQVERMRWALRTISRFQLCEQTEKLMDLPSIARSALDFRRLGSTEGGE
jgi:hypothetical protein